LRNNARDYISDGPGRRFLWRDYSFPVAGDPDGAGSAIFAKMDGVD